MASLGKSIGGLTATLMGGRPPKLPPLPAGLGLPEKSKGIATYNENRGNIASDAQYKASLAQANTYNQSLVQLLNQQPHLSGAERTEIYRYYNDDMPTSAIPVYNGMRKKYGGVTDLMGQLSQQGPQAEAPAPAPAPAAAPAAAEPVYTAPLPPAASVTPAPVTQPAQAVTAPKPVAPAAPQTVGPVAKPAEPPPPPTPVVATSGGNIAGSTQTTGGNEDTSGKSRGRRGRTATLLTGLGGALERFGS